MSRSKPRAVRTDRLVMSMRGKSRAMNFLQSSAVNRSLPIVPPMSMGTRLQEALDLRQRSAPDVIAACRLSKGAIYNILNDVTKPDKVRAETINKVAGYLNVDRDWLI